MEAIAISEEITSHPLQNLFKLLPVTELNNDEWRLPNHTQLPDRDDNFVKNFQEHPQSILLTDTITPWLQSQHPENNYAIGQDCGIYWNLAAALGANPVRGAIAPDWFYVPGVPTLPSGQFRRSYVLWQEYIAPLIIIEFVSGNGDEERDQTPYRGKFWIYEQVIRAPFYAIYEVTLAKVEVYCLVTGQYQKMPPNERNHHLIAPLELELGIWQGRYQAMELPWLRWYDTQGILLPTGEERANQEQQRANQEQRRAEQEQQRANQEQQRANQEQRRAEQEQQRAEQEKQRADREKERAERLAAQLRALGIDSELS